MNVHRPIAAAILAGALTAPATAVAHSPPATFARAAALIEPVRIAPTTQQLDAMLTGARLAQEYAAGVGWPDRCAGQQTRELHANLSAQATAYGFAYAVAGLSWYTECRWAIDPAYATSPAALCSTSAHEEAHGIRGDGWHSTGDPTGPLETNARTFPACAAHYQETTADAPADRTHVQRPARRVLRHRRNCRRGRHHQRLRTAKRSVARHRCHARRRARTHR